MPHPLETKLAAAWPPEQWADVTVAVAVSGGCDSVALLLAMTALKTGGEGRLLAVHLNHQLRPEAEQDERFVVDLCAGLGVKCEVGRIAVRDAIRGGEGVEAAARRCRYRFLHESAGRHGARYVALAHTADDQAETILHRIVRGTGVRGLSGMARVRPLGHAALVRPFLGIRRRELVTYLADLGQAFRDDSSNLDRRYTRNRIRHGLLPRLREQFNPEIDAALLRLGVLAGEAQAVIDRLVDERFERCVVSAGVEAATVDLDAVADWPRYMVRELFAAVWRRRRWPMGSMGLAQWDELAEMALSRRSPARRDFPGGVTAEVAAGRMRLSRQ